MPVSAEIGVYLDSRICLESLSSQSPRVLSLSSPVELSRAVRSLGPPTHPAQHSLTRVEPARFTLVSSVHSDQSHPTTPPHTPQGTPRHVQPPRREDERKQASKQASKHATPAGLASTRPSPLKTGDALGSRPSAKQPGEAKQTNMNLRGGGCCLQCLGREKRRRKGSRDVVRVSVPRRSRLAISTMRQPQ